MIPMSVSFRVYTSWNPRGTSFKKKSILDYRKTSHKILVIFQDNQDFRLFLEIEILKTFYLVIVIS
jgi:hypothetical protein